MASSLWSKGVKQIALRRTAYGYLYRIDVQVDYAWVLKARRLKNDNFDAGFVKRTIKYESDRQHGWRHKNIHPVTDDRVLNAIARLHQIVEGRTIRVSRKWVRSQMLTVYSNDQQELHKLFGEIYKLKPLVPRLHRVHYVPDEIRESVLAGKKVVKRIGKHWTHEVRLREGQVTDNLKSVVNYLESLGELVERPQTLNRVLKNKYAYGLWFRTSDKSILDFVLLIAPDSISKVIELEHQP